MKIVKMSEAFRNTAVRKRIVAGMRSGDVFVYPTDTIYGMGCNALMLESVMRIRKAKGRDEDKHFSVIAPGFDWLHRNADVPESSRMFIESLLPGPYTIIVRANARSPKAVVSTEGGMGVRIPKHPFAELVTEAGIPFVSTSVNLSGEQPVTSIREIPAEIAKVTDWAIDAGRICGPSSRVFDLRDNDVKILRY